ncbi:MAG: radical SAM protein [Acidobacteriota bacterium]
MKILLVSMPDTILPFKWAEGWVPHLGISSIAGNLDRKRFTVRLLDLVIRPYGVRNTVKRAVEELRPHVVGLTAMSFQYRMASRIARLVKSIDSSIITVLGGYHATLAEDVISTDRYAGFVDFLVRGEGEATVRELLETIDSEGRNFSGIPGVSFKDAGMFVHNPSRPLLDLRDVALPDRETRLLGYKDGWNGMIDCVETSRGCTMSCNFCSIRGMYGRNFRVYSIDRIIEDIRRVKRLGARRVFFTDDNITLDVERFKSLCVALVENQVNDLRYSVQASTIGIARNPELAPLMREANFTLVYLGIDGLRDAQLQFMKKGRVQHDSVRAVELLLGNGIQVMGGFIAGLPDDAAQDIRDIFRFIKDHSIAAPIVWGCTPYPRTQLREDLLREGLIVNKDDYSAYNGWNTLVRTRHMSRRRVGYERTRGYLGFLVRTFIRGDNYYIRQLRSQSFWRMARARIAALWYFLHAPAGTWQSTHGCSFHPWWQYPFLPLVWLWHRIASVRRCIATWIGASSRTAPARDRPGALARSE